MSRVLAGLFAASLAVPAAIGLGATDVAWAPVAQISPAPNVQAPNVPAVNVPAVNVPASKDSDDSDDGDDHKRKSSTQRVTEHAEDIDVSKLSDEDVAALGMVAEALVVIAIASAI